MHEHIYILHSYIHSYIEIDRDEVPKTDRQTICKIQTSRIKTDRQTMDAEGYLNRQSNDHRKQTDEQTDRRTDRQTYKTESGRGLTSLSWMRVKMSGRVINFTAGSFMRDPPAVGVATSPGGGPSTTSITDGRPS